RVLSGYAASFKNLLLTELFQRLREIGAFGECRVARLRRLVELARGNGLALGYLQRPSKRARVPNCTRNPFLLGHWLLAFLDGHAPFAIERFIARRAFLDAMGTVIRVVLGRRPRLARLGIEARSRCPFRHDSSYSFSSSPAIH